MRLPTLLIAIGAAAITSLSLAQPASTPSERDRSSGSSETRSAGAKSSYDADDCRKDMENARDARQAGHITEKEYAEQKKMALTKLKRDSGQTGASDKGVDCK
ncbi:hypothetical protein [Noviherbaspirillum sp. ST9]|uniref:hypothetical protein n=1 Tax=Noviherbaspirillum sp. ST9 TaxID=3401606 RepID=UPI003B58AB7E